MFAVFVSGQLERILLEKLEEICETRKYYMITYVMMRKDFTRKVLPSRRNEQMEVLVGGKDGLSPA